MLQLVGFVNLGLLIFLYSTKYTSIKFVNTSFYPHLFFMCATTAIIHIWAILCLLSLFTKCSFIFFYSFILQCYQIEPFKIVFWSLNTSLNHIFSTHLLCSLYQINFPYKIFLFDFFIMASYSCFIFQISFFIFVQVFSKYSDWVWQFHNMQGRAGGWKPPQQLMLPSWV